MFRTLAGCLGAKESPVLEVCRGLSAKCSWLWEKLLPDTKHVHISAIVWCEIDLETADRTITSTDYNSDPLNCASNLLTVMLFYLIALRYSNAHTHTHRFTHEHLGTPLLEQNDDVKISQLSGGGDWRAQGKESLETPNNLNYWFYLGLRL